MSWPPATTPKRSFTANTRKQRGISKTSLVYYLPRERMMMIICQENLGANKKKKKRMFLLRRRKAKAIPTAMGQRWLSQLTLENSDSLPEAARRSALVSYERQSLLGVLHGGATASEKTQISIIIITIITTIITRRKGTSNRHLRLLPMDRGI